MSTLANRLGERSEVDSFCVQAAQLVREAEESMHQIISNTRACDAERLAAVEILEAMKRVQLLIEAHHDTVAKGMAFSPVVRSIPEKRRRWRFIA
ncbi:hypothetical protein [Methylobacterium planeticum]|uniref:Uncharacterized protein n=1 Tax=Methylobacterium planeticum TaxID=2615211 RepID=A0A6N6MPL8_9HYPH|nr:hypothetical protein [Methylobacterium planeticum]KAB1072955.1 hypothetical protein F6X51_13280 [Methylobacterium planeticum]